MGILVLMVKVQLLLSDAFLNLGSIFFMPQLPFILFLLLVKAKIYKMLWEKLYVRFGSATIISTTFGGC